ncbi:FAD-binding 8 [Penicillium concentricum]|uniref:FAD-binding 8 n=1 Tax=Penicillium concentricum TaxID=293559 RepID=A0A9W9V9A7_9EURO|nr:FAD-binding 8 [Penicillium concentricum]KAJ5373542.1 FAD-binding 8 [Penicillium concentricum]
MLPRAAFVALFWATVQVSGHGGSSSSSSRNVASNLEEYCFYSIYTSLSAYTFEGSVTVQSATSSHSHGGSSSSSHGSSDSSTETSETSSHGSSDASSETSGASSHESSDPSSTETSETHSHGSSGSSSAESPDSSSAAHTYGSHNSSSTETSESSYSGYTHGSSDSSSTESTDSTSSTHTHGSARRSVSLAKRAHGSGSYGSYSTGPCNSTVEVTSMYASAKAWCSEKEFKAVVPYWQSLCAKNSMELMSLTSIEPLLTDDFINSLPQIDPEENNVTTYRTIDSPVLLTKKYYNRAHKSYVSHDYAMPKHKRYGWGIIGYWGAVLVLGMMSKAWTVFFSRRSVRGSCDPETRPGLQSKKGPLASLFHSLRTHIIMPATFAPAIPNHQQLWLSHALPKRVDTLIVLGFWIVSIILSCVGYDSFTGSLSVPSLYQQNWQYTSDRTGVLSYACLPALWLFSGRNNVFIQMTHFSVQSFTMFHRHIAWVCTILAVVHSINYTVLFLEYVGRYWISWKEEFWYMGVVATILLCFMLVQSMTFFQRRWYETFLMLHIIFAVVVVVALFQHTSFDGREWVGYLWTPVGLWVLERLARVGRVVYCNLNARFGKEFLGTATTVTYSEASDLVRIEMVPGAASLTPRPGQLYYIYQATWLKGWENHPFSLGAWAPSSTADNEKSAPASQNGQKLIFYVRPYDGWTRRLRDQCRKAGGIIRPKLLLEGAYGHSEPVYAYNTLLIIVGGTGIAVAVPYLLDHIARVKEGKTKTTKIQLVWSVRQKEMFNEVFNEELAEIMQHNDITITVFCTRLSKITSDSDSDDVTISKELSSGVAPVIRATGADSPTSNSSLRFMPGRPDIREIVKSEVQDSQNSSTNLAVLTCGPAQMADECRGSVYETMKNGFQDIEYFEEAFGW